VFDFVFEGNNEISSDFGDNEDNEDKSEEEQMAKWVEGRVTRLAEFSTICRFGNLHVRHIVGSEIRNSEICLSETCNSET
jgi:hypothetical protein